MPDYVDYWDDKSRTQKRRVCTAAEQAAIDAARAVSPVPARVTRKAARLALAKAGKFHMVQPAIDSMPEPQRTLVQIEWDDSQTFERASSTVAMIGAAIGSTSAELDALFIAAATLE